MVLGDGGLRPTGRRLDCVRISEKEVANDVDDDMAGPGLFDSGGLREGATTVELDERLLVESGVNLR